MKTVQIKIKDNLTPEKEALEIAKKLITKKLLGNTSKFLGNGVEVQNLKTVIEVTRIPYEKAVISKECPCCQTTFQKSSGISLYVNYGGKVTLKKYCSKECADYVFSFLGEKRASFDRKKIGTSLLF